MFEELNSIKSSRKDLKNFGVTIGFILLMIGAFLFVKEKALFCGDTLFNAGVGGVHAETANIRQLYDSLKKISRLDGDIKPYPAHDYWQNNRLSYWPMIIAGDFDTLRPVFEYFLQIKYIKTITKKYGIGTKSKSNPLPKK